MAMPLEKAHQAVLGRNPSEDQVRFYTCWPKFKGFSDRGLSEPRAEAVILAALLSGTAADRVVVLTPHAQEQWLLKQCENVALTCFENSKKYPTRAAGMIQSFTRMFQKLVMTGRPFQLQSEPEHWVAFGFAVDDTLPAWLSGRLVGL